MATHYLRKERTPFFCDEDGVLSVVKAEDSVESYTLDWRDVLASGETLSTLSTAGTSGVTVSASSLSSPTTSVTLTSTGGTVVHTVTTSASRTLVRNLNVYADRRAGS